jgi:hypothetical protein
MAAAAVAIRGVAISAAVVVAIAAAVRGVSVAAAVLVLRPRARLARAVVRVPNKWAADGRRRDPSKVDPVPKVIVIGTRAAIVTAPRPRPETAAAVADKVRGVRRRDRGPEMVRNRVKADKGVAGVVHKAATPAGRDPLRAEAAAGRRRSVRWPRKKALAPKSAAFSRSYSAAEVH